MMEMAYRVPDNMVGHTLRQATSITQDMNKDTMNEI